MRSGPERARPSWSGAGSTPTLAQARRFAIVNLWRPIGGPVEKPPLAFCDARTIRPSDLIAVDLVYRDRVGETYALQHDPGQLWYYFPRLAPDEAILIKGYDSRPGRRPLHRRMPRSRIRRGLPQAPERESIETRALIFWPG